jgi:hypothetical protein
MLLGEAKLDDIVLIVREAAVQDYGLVGLLGRVTGENSIERRVRMLDEPDRNRWLTNWTQVEVVMRELMREPTREPTREPR